MPDLDWQNIAALGAVAVAGVYLVSRLWRRGLSSGACDACSKCGAASGDQALIPVESLRKHP